jgi:hypothetical protein
MLWSVYLIIVCLMGGLLIIKLYCMCLGVTMSKNFYNLDELTQNNNDEIPSKSKHKFSQGITKNMINFWRYSFEKDLKNW